MLHSIWYNHTYFVHVHTPMKWYVFTKLDEHTHNLRRKRSSTCTQQPHIHLNTYLSRRRPANHLEGVRLLSWPDTDTHTHTRGGVLLNHTTKTRCLFSHHPVDPSDSCITFTAQPNTLLHTNISRPACGRRPQAWRAGGNDGGGGGECRRQGDFVVERTVDEWVTCAYTVFGVRAYAPRITTHISANSFHTTHNHTHTNT